MTYRAYLRTFDGHVSEKTITTDQAAAAEAFATLVNRTDLDGQKMAATVTYHNRQLAFHRFDRTPGCTDYWRDKLDEIEWPGTPGRPIELDNARHRTYTVQDKDHTTLQALGNGNASRGLRVAADIARQHTED